MSYMFSYTGRNATTWSIGDLSNWNTSRVTDMSCMFEGAGDNATSWNSIGILKVYADDISVMFHSCPKAKATLSIINKPSTTYTSNGIFEVAATANDALITVNYTSAVDNIDDIIAT